MRISLPILDHVAKAIISRIPKVEDRSLFIHDILIRMKMWTHEGICPIVTRVFGTITIDGHDFCGFAIPIISVPFRNKFSTIDMIYVR
jgi:hypothetical protein